MDMLSLQDLAIWTRIGVTEDERKAEQEVRVGVWFPVDTSKAGASDNVQDTIDYHAVADCMKELAKAERKTIERLAEDIAKELLASFKVQRVTVHVRKFVLGEGTSASLSIDRP